MDTPAVLAAADAASVGAAGGRCAVDPTAERLFQKQRPEKRLTTGGCGSGRAGGPGSARARPFPGPLSLGSLQRGGRAELASALPMGGPPWHVPKELPLGVPGRCPAAQRLRGLAIWQCYSPGAAQVMDESGVGAPESHCQPLRRWQCDLPFLAMGLAQAPSPPEPPPTPPNPATTPEEANRGKAGLRANRWPPARPPLRSLVRVLFSRQSAPPRDQPGSGEGRATYQLETALACGKAPAKGKEITPRHPFSGRSASLAGTRRR
jgi:hypothetical protein